MLTYCNQKGSYRLFWQTILPAYWITKRLRQCLGARDSGTRRHAPRFSRRARASRLLRVSLPPSISYSRTSFLPYLSTFFLFISHTIPFFLSFSFFLPSLNALLFTPISHLLFSLCSPRYLYLSSFFMLLF